MASGYANAPSEVGDVDNSSGNDDCVKPVETGQFEGPAPCVDGSPVVAGPTAVPLTMPVVPCPAAAMPPYWQAQGAAPPTGTDNANGMMYVMAPAPQAGLPYPVCAGVGPVPPGAVGCVTGPQQSTAVTAVVPSVPVLPAGPTAAVVPAGPVLPGAAVMLPAAAVMPTCAAGPAGPPVPNAVGLVPAPVLTAPVGGTTAPVMPGVQQGDGQAMGIPSAPVFAGGSQQPQFQAPLSPQAMPMQPPQPVPYGPQQMQHPMPQQPQQQRQQQRHQHMQGQQFDPMQYAQGPGGSVHSGWSRQPQAQGGKGKGRRGGYGGGNSNGGHFGGYGHDGDQSRPRRHLLEVECRDSSSSVFCKTHWPEGGYLPDQEGHELRWHPCAGSVGVLSEDGHTFEKESAEARDTAYGYQLSTLTMLFESTLHNGGVRTYEYRILRGSLGLADGVGFVLDNTVRRMNIQKMRSIFMNRNGQICIRDRGEILRLNTSLPQLAPRIAVWVRVDLNASTIQFQVENCSGECRRTEVLHIPTQFAQCARNGATPALPRSGFFCAILAGRSTVSLH